MQIVFLDKATLGDDISTKQFERFGTVTEYPSTSPDCVPSRIIDAEVVVINKVKLNESNLANALRLKLICITATGFDNVDLPYCKKRGIAVCNVVGYSTQCVSQLTVAMALSLITHLPEFQKHVASGAYANGTVANCLTPCFHEIYGKTWGIFGYGNIGKQVGAVAKALGCRVIVCKRTPIDGEECVDVDTLCRESDILSIHTPLNDATREIINRERIAMLKPSAIVINVARGAVTDEKALADAVLEQKIGGIGVDVYSAEPMPVSHPFSEIAHLPNVCLTPHMAWGGYETRVRLLNEIEANIVSFLEGGSRNRLDID